MWRTAVAAAQPAACLPAHWPKLPRGRLAVIACGKAAAPMAAEASKRYGFRCSGIVILPAESYDPGHTAPRFQYYPAAHPVPDERSVSAARAALRLATTLTPKDLLLVLLSGGGSALMCLPADGVSLGEKQDLTRRLLACGANIEEINTVRQQLSRVKGGQLTQASRAPVVTLAISDVPGDDPCLIASGPTEGCRSTATDALGVLTRYGIEPSAGVIQALRDDGDGKSTRKPSAHRHDNRDEFHVIASGMTALNAAADWCRGNKINPVILGDRLQSESRALAREHARAAQERVDSRAPSCLLSGGETTVTLGSNPGYGGRNTEYALALALELRGRKHIWALAADTDGIDGRGGHSGAIVDPSILERAKRLGLDAAEHLSRNDSATFFEHCGGLLREGATGTNVNDFRAILVVPGS